MTTAEKLELELRREGLLRKSARLHEVTAACKVATRAAARHKRLAETECNGLPKYNAATQSTEMRLDETDTARLDKEMAQARDAAKTALKSILIAGLEYDFRNDHVYCMVRVRDKANSRAFSL